jgi:AcrR family transcriptional regulator
MKRLSSEDAQSGAMTDSTPKIQERPQTKRGQREASIDRILESALDLMVVRGCNATTVDDIAKRAGLTKGAIYFHFENKTAVVLALLDIVEKLLIGGLTDRLAGAGPTNKDKLVAALHNQGILAGSKTKYLMMFTLTLLEFSGTGTEIESRVRAIYESFVQSVEKIVRAGCSAGEFRKDLDARELAAVVLALQHGTLMEWYCRSDTLNGQGLVRSARVVLLDGLMHGLAPPQKDA